MNERIHQPVAILASFSLGPHHSVKVVPHRMKWQGRTYKMDKMGLYHPERRGSKLFHIFSFSADNTAFRLELNPDTLEWTLVGVYYGT